LQQNYSIPINIITYKTNLTHPNADTKTIMKIIIIPFPLRLTKAMVCTENPTYLELSVNTTNERQNFFTYNQNNYIIYSIIEQNIYLPKTKYSNKPYQTQYPIKFLETIIFFTHFNNNTIPNEKKKSGDRTRALIFYHNKKPRGLHNFLTNLIFQNKPFK